MCMIHTQHGRPFHRTHVRVCISHYIETLAQDPNHRTTTKMSNSRNNKQANRQAHSRDFSHHRCSRPAIHYCLFTWVSPHCAIDAHCASEAHYDMLAKDPSEGQTTTTNNCKTIAATVKQTNKLAKSETLLSCVLSNKLSTTLST